MALINCPEPQCNRQFSNTAKTCPQCGFDVTKHKEDKTNKAKFYFYIAVIPILALIYFTGTTESVVNFIGKPVRDFLMHFLKLE